MSEKKEPEKAEKTDAAPAPAEGGGSKLTMIVTLLNLLITVGIGAVVFIQFQKDKHKELVTDISAEPEAKDDAKKGEEKGGEHGEAAKPAEGEHGGEAKKEGGEHGAEAAKPNPNAAKIVTLEQFTVNLSTTVGTPPRFARVLIAIEVPSDDTANEINQKMAPVRNAILDLFNSKRPVDLQTGEGRNFLKEEIKNALNSFLVTGKVKGVYFANFTISS
jgi:flagellar basal body-associated protein FliL